MRRGKERATATTVSGPETRNWEGNDNTKQFFIGETEQGKEVREGKPGSTGKGNYL